MRKVRCKKLRKNLSEIYEANKVIINDRHSICQPKNTTLVSGMLFKYIKYLYNRSLLRGI